MEAEGCLYPFDEEGRRIKPSRLPARLAGLRADPYRDLAWSVREAGGYDKGTRPYSEFAWADYFREQISERAIDRDYDAAVAKAVQLARRKDAAGLPGCRATGRTEWGNLPGRGLPGCWSRCRVDGLVLGEADANVAARRILDDPKLGTGLTRRYQPARVVCKPVDPIGPP